MARPDAVVRPGAYITERRSGAACDLRAPITRGSARQFVGFVAQDAGQGLAAAAGGAEAGCVGDGGRRMPPRRCPPPSRRLRRRSCKAVSRRGARCRQVLSRRARDAWSTCSGIGGSVATSCSSRKSSEFIESSKCALASAAIRRSAACGRHSETRSYIATYCAPMRSASTQQYLLMGDCLTVGQGLERAAQPQSYTYTRTKTHDCRRALFSSLVTAE